MKELLQSSIQPLSPSLSVSVYLGRPLRAEIVFEPLRRLNTKISQCVRVRVRLCVCFTFMWSQKSKTHET